MFAKFINSFDFHNEFAQNNFFLYLLKLSTGKKNPENTNMVIYAVNKSTSTVD